MVRSEILQKNMAIFGIYVRLQGGLKIFGMHPIPSAPAPAPLSAPLTGPEELPRAHKQAAASWTWRSCWGSWPWRSWQRRVVFEKPLRNPTRNKQKFISWYRNYLMYDIPNYYLYIYMTYPSECISSYDFMISHNILHGFLKKTLDTYYATGIPHKTWSTPHRGAKAGAQNFPAGKHPNMRATVRKTWLFHRDPDFMIYEIIP